MASKLLDTLTHIETGRKQCINNARLANLDADDNMDFTDIANLFLLKNTPDNVGGWIRPSDWWDCESILADAENKTDDNNVTVYPAYILLLADWDKTTTFKKSYGNVALQGDGYLTSDGAWYGTSDATHTWDETKDKPCAEGYCTRWVMVYMKNPTGENHSIIIRDFRALEMIADKVKISYCYVGGQNDPRNRDIIHIKFSANTDYTTIANSRDYADLFNLRSISFPKVTSIGSYAFRWTTSLMDVDLPNVVSIGDSAFYQCPALRNINIPNVETIGPTVFSVSGGGTALSKLYCPKLISIGNNAFSGCSSLISIYAPLLNTIGQGAFMTNRSLSTLSLPNLTTIGINAFVDCFSLESVYLPKISSVGAGAFSGCNSVARVDIPTTFTSNQITNLCTAWTKYINLYADWKTSGVNLTSNTGLTHSCLNDILDKLADVTEETDTYTFTLGSTNLAKLSAEEIAVGTNKGWVIN